ncbi:hypothetical protein MAM1_0277d09125 [Mucor ambiguus]|uniref:C2H2-type domain-containing protein n=1 Tax=Mucor ambiguus TaxID=91626 RepID=A0A0C9LX37_9FUNG|nr:hypothetical protein MAM1_0277d09125 [Mucor ambiguus]
MKHSLTQLPSKKKQKKRTVRDGKRTIQVAMPPAYKDEKLAFATGTDEVSIKNQCARLQNESAKNKTMNPAKIVDHSSLIIAENRLIKARYKHHAHLSRNSNGTRRSNNESETAMPLADGSQAADTYDKVVVDTSCQTATTSTTGALCNASNGHRTNHELTLDPDKLHLCSIRSKYSTLRHKRRKLNAASNMVDVEAEDQKIQRALSESLQGSQVEVEINPIISNLSSYPHPVINDPNNYCRVCHVSHSTQKAYQIHLQTKHHVAFPSSSTKRKAQKSPAVTRPDNLSKYIPIQITFDPKSSPAAAREQMKNANVQPDFDDPNHYCRSCHITKPNRKSYLTHLCMIHQTTSRKKDYSKAPNVKTKY